MENKVKTSDIPHQAHRLYIKLYCERKGNKSKDTITAAKKSWLSLSIHKKKLFYETTNNRNLLNNTYSLCKSKIYLKEKYPKQNKEKLESNDEIVLCSSVKEDENHKKDNNTIECDQSIETINDTIQDSTCIEGDVEDNNTSDNSQDCINTAIDLNSTEPNCNNTVPDCNNTAQDCNNTALDCNNTVSDCNNTVPDCNYTVPDCNSSDSPETEVISTNRSNIPNLKNIVDSDSDTDSSEEEDNIIRDSTTKILSEPIPPTVKDGRELYNMIKKHDAPDFKTLDRKDKTHYHAAVRNLKKEYIKSYTHYLESLSKQELFDHYVKTFY